MYKCIFCDYAVAIPDEPCPNDGGTSFALMRHYCVTCHRWVGPFTADNHEADGHCITEKRYDPVESREGK